MLGGHRADGRYEGVPDGATRIAPGDQLVLYARAGRIAELDRRARGVAGDRAHAAAASERRGAGAGGLSGPATSAAPAPR